MSELNSKVIIAKGIKMDRSYNNVLSYSESDLLTLMQSESHYVASYYKFSFIQQQKSMVVNFTYSQCEQANYLAFQNPAYDNKWFFAWIDEVIYRGDSATEITFTIDAWSTWYGSWTKKTCYIERQHVLNDTIGANTVPENLDIGNVVCDVEVTETSYQKNQPLGLISYYVAVDSEYVIKGESEPAIPPANPRR